MYTGIPNIRILCKNVQTLAKFGKNSAELLAMFWAKMQFYIDELDLELSSFLPQWALLGLNKYAYSLTPVVIC